MTGFRFKWREESLWLRAVLVAIFLVLVALVWGIFEFGRYQGGHDRKVFNEVRERLQTENTGLREELRKLRQEKIELEQTLRIESQAYSLVRNDLRDLQDELLELKEELAFYRGIVSPKESGRGLQIQRFTVVRGGKERSWRFKLVLTRVLRNRGTAKGTVEIRVEGTREDGERSFVPTIQSLRYNFKYFQNIEGELTLPEGFVPSRAIVVLKPGGKGNRTQLKKSFDWPAEPGST